MEQENQSPAKGVFDAVVLSNRQIGLTFWKLRLEFSGAGARAFSRFRPGQFAQLDASTAELPPVEKIPEQLADAAQRQILLRQHCRHNGRLRRIFFCHAR